MTEKIAQQTEKQDKKILIEESRSYRLTLTLRNNRMECLAEIQLFPPEISDDEPASTTQKTPPALTPPDLFRLLRQHGMNETIDHAAVYEFCACLDFGVTPEPLVLAKGVDPVFGRDGWFELQVRTSGEDACFKEDERGNIDLRNRHAYSEIESGQKLGVVHPPEEGRAGFDVLGMSVFAPPGEPFILLPGEGVLVKYDGRVAVATKPGRALFENGKLSVVDLLVIPGGVDLSVGDINFHGFVDIKGDVPDDFDIKATRGIKVAGVVGACRIESGGTIELASMAGREKGEIICHGHLFANYLNQVQVTCFGDVSVVNEIRNSVVKATGQIVVESGAILGGRCIAMDGIEVKNLGTRSGLKTHIVAGVYFPDSDRFDYLRKQLKDIQQQIKSIDLALGPLKIQLKRGSENSGAAETRLAILNEQLDKLYEDKNNFTAEMKASKPQVFFSMNPKINVHSDLMPDVVLTLGQTTEEVRIKRTGPLSIIENTCRGGFRYLSLTPLPVKAKTLEEEIIAAETVEAAVVEEDLCDEIEAQQ